MRMGISGTLTRRRLCGSAPRHAVDCVQGRTFKRVRTCTRRTQNTACRRADTHARGGQPPVGVVQTLSTVIVNRVLYADRNSLVKPRLAAYSPYFATYRSSVNGSMPSASTLALPPTTMMPAPLPSESRFRLTRGCALMCLTFAALGIEYTITSEPSK